MNAIGVDLGGTNIKAALVSQDGKFLAKKHVKTEVSSGKERVAAKIADIVNDLGQGDRSICVGIGSPGSIDRKNGLVRFSPNLPGWLDFPLAPLVSEKTGREVLIENDAKAAALGEKWNFIQLESSSSNKITFEIRSNKPNFNFSFSSVNSSLLKCSSTLRCVSNAGARS